MELHPALYVGWNKLLVGFEAVLELGAWEVTTLPEALFVSVVGVLLLLLGLHLLNLLARVSKWYTEFMLGDAYSLVSEVTKDRGVETP